jgi:general secretion pathway protein A
VYLSYFNLDSQPFSIVPDHRALYMSHSHREAVAHLLYAMNESGGFVQLTGEVGTGKTTVCRYILSNLPDDVDVALLINPRITEKEMLEAICDELGITYGKTTRQKDLVTLLNDYLIEAHSNGRRTVLIVDEAQTLSREVLEQVRLLTNLETSSAKLLQIILIGQPELSQTLQRHDLRQLSQRIVGRFSLKPLNHQETREYIEHRLNISGVQRALFSKGAISRIHRLSGGIPRLINVLCDRALLGAYGQNLSRVGKRIVNQAGREVLNEMPGRFSLRMAGWLKYAAIAALPLLAYLVYQYYQEALTSPETAAVTVSGTGFSGQAIEVDSTTAAASPLAAVDAAKSTLAADLIAATEAVEKQGHGEIQATPVPQEAIQATGKVENMDAVAETAPAAEAVAGNSLSEAASGNEQDEPEARGFDLTYRLGVPLDQDVIQDQAN